MKYYELVAESWLKSPKIINKELTVVKETAKQIQLTGSATYTSHFNKSKLNKVHDLGTSRVYIVYSEDFKEEAYKLMLEYLDSEMNFHLDKAQTFEKLINEVKNNG